MSAANGAGIAIKGLRKQFAFATKDVTHYFPGHMAKGMNQMQRKLKHVDCIIEVHDARIPFSGRNARFEEALLIRPHLLILNKMDLTNLKYRQRVEEKIREEQNIKNILYTNCKEDLNRTVKHKILPTVMKMIDEAPRYHRVEERDYNLLIIGVPNVGKSSLINALRRTNLKKGKATPVGGVAGITRSVLEKIRVCDHPRTYVFDTPGILNPMVDSVDVGMKLALCANLKDSLVGEDMIVDYMLHWLNVHQEFGYVQYYGLTEPTDVLYEFLTHIAKTRNMIMKVRGTTGGYIYKPNFTQVAQLVLRDFRSGLLGKFNLDMDLLQHGSQTKDLT